ncbi:hypothetical protein LguiA_004701 [Lonicera macranthoides]
MATAQSLYTKNYNTSSNIIMVKSMATNGTSVEAATHRRRIIKNNEMMSPLENQVYLSSLSPPKPPLSGRFSSLWGAAVSLIKIFQNSAHSLELEGSYSPFPICLRGRIFILPFPIEPAEKSGWKIIGVVSKPKHRRKRRLNRTSNEEFTIHKSWQKLRNRVK